jgi:hypothetical protein
VIDNRFSQSGSATLSPEVAFGFVTGGRDCPSATPAKPRPESAKKERREEESAFMEKE